MSDVKSLSVRFLVESADDEPFRPEAPCSVPECEFTTSGTLQLSLAGGAPFCTFPLCAVHREIMRAEFGVAPC